MPGSLKQRSLLADVRLRLIALCIATAATAVIAGCKQAPPAAKPQMAAAPVEAAQPVHGHAVNLFQLFVAPDAQQFDHVYLRDGVPIAGAGDLSRARWPLTQHGQAKARLYFPLHDLARSECNSGGRSHRTAWADSR